VRQTMASTTRIGIRPAQNKAATRGRRTRKAIPSCIWFEAQLCPIPSAAATSAAPESQLSHTHREPFSSSSRLRRSAISATAASRCAAAADSATDHFSIAATTSASARCRNSESNIHSII
jgi:hypothetical protein